MALRACMMHLHHSSKEHTLEKLSSKCDLLEMLTVDTSPSLDSI